MIKNIIFAIIVSIVSLISIKCEDNISSQNGHQNQNIDTSNIKYLDSAMSISIIVAVTEWDKATHSGKPSVGASVHFVNSDTTVITDSTGCANAFFAVDSIPFEYSYEITKEGFKKCYYSSWEKNANIRSDMIINKIQ